MRQYYYCWRKHSIPPNKGLGPLLTCGTYMQQYKCHCGTLLVIGREATGALTSLNQPLCLVLYFLFLILWEQDKMSLLIIIIYNKYIYYIYIHYLWKVHFSFTVPNIVPSSPYFMNQWIMKYFPVLSNTVWKYATKYCIASFF